MLVYWVTCYLRFFALSTFSFIDYFKDLQLHDSSMSESSEKDLTPVSHLHVEGRQHPVRIFYLQDPTPCYVTEARKTVFKLHENRPLGADILVFLTSEFFLFSLIILRFR